MNKTLTDIMDPIYTAQAHARYWLKAAEQHMCEHGTEMTEDLAYLFNKVEIWTNTAEALLQKAHELAGALANLSAIASANPHLKY